MFAFILKSDHMKLSYKLDEQMGNWWKFVFSAGFGFYEEERDYLR